MTSNFSTPRDRGSKLSLALAALFLLPLVAGCGPGSPGSPGEDAAESVFPDDDGGPALDDDAGPDAGAPDAGEDAGADAGDAEDDAGAPDDEDAGSGPDDEDAGLPPVDAAVPDEDAGGGEHDAGAPDAGPDTGSDAGSEPETDAGADAGTDGGPSDSGVVDGGAPDAGEPTWDAGIPARRTCLEHLHAGESVDGVYPIDPEGHGATVGVWCDMTTDEGGWTLVAATRGTTLNDERSDWHDDLARERPTTPRRGVWDGLRARIGEHSDVRFTCRVDGAPGASGGFDVDLSFYDVGWYREITTGSDADACFEEGNGAGYTGPWARRNNLTGELKSAADDYDHGYQGFPPHFEGEDSCADEGDFAVDFDDRGMDSVPFDGTDWGEDDHGLKCGSVSPANGAWFIWVRELDG